MSCKENNAIGRAEPVAALYVHVPFCRAKCQYCDFYSLAGAEDKEEAYPAAIQAELGLRKDRLRRPLESLYVGGGTPTALAPRRLEGLLEMLTLWVGPKTEFSVEANPGTVDREVADTLAGAGVNRVTLGAQSFEEGELRRLGRIHQAGEISRAADRLGKAGIVNIGLDLIYGIPGQTLDSWRQSLRLALELHPKHLSCYALSFEPETPLSEDLSAGRVSEIDDETQFAMYALAVETLRQGGLEQYEISNFARPGFRCRQNLTYWRNEPYVGIGPAACSYLDGERRTNAPDLEAYLQALRGRPARLPPAQCERLTGRREMAETLMLGLRLVDGVEIETFRGRFGQAPQQAFPKSFERYARQGALEISDTHVRLTDQTRFTANTVLADILAEADHDL